MTSWTTGETITATRLNYMCPTGAIILYGGTTAPTDWLLCDGTAVSRTTYANLFGIIGTSYGVGDGSTTFNVPDFLGRTVIGTGSGSGLTVRARGDKVGTETHSLSVDELASHYHNYYNPLAAGSLQTPIPGSSAAGLSATSETGSGTAHQNMQPSGVATYIIKT